MCVQKRNFATSSLIQVTNLARDKDELVQRLHQDNSADVDRLRTLQKDNTTLNHRVNHQCLPICLDYWSWSYISVTCLMLFIHSGEELAERTRWNTRSEREGWSRIWPCDAATEQTDDRIPGQRQSPRGEQLTDKTTPCCVMSLCNGFFKSTDIFVKILPMGDWSINSLCLSRYILRLYHQAWESSFKFENSNYVTGSPQSAISPT